MKQHKLKYGLLLFLAFCSINLLWAQGEKVFFTKLNQDHGLPQNHVFSMFQDQSGYVWVCTMGGLAKYDGKDFRVYTHEENDSSSLSGNWIYKVIKTTNGQTYVATTHGLNRLSLKTGQAKKFFHDASDKSSLSSNAVHDLVEVDSTHLAVATTKVIDIFNTQKENFVRYGHETFSGNRHTPCLLKAKNGAIWAGATEGLYQLEKGKRELTYFPLLDEQGNAIAISELLENEDGTIWVGSFQGLFLFDPTVEKFTHVPFDSTDVKHHVRTLLAHPPEKLYIGTNNGLFYWDKVHKKLLKKYAYASDNPEGISHDGVYSLMKDDQNNIWIGLFNGINIINPEAEKFKLYINQTGINNPNNTILRVFSDHQNRVWMNTMQGLFVKQNHLSAAKEVLLPPHFTKGYQPVQHFAEDEEGNIWITVLGDGLYKISGASNKPTLVKAPNFFKTDKLYTLEFDLSNHDLLWVATARGICGYHISTADTTWIRPANEMEDTRQNSVVYFNQHQNGDIWFVNSSQLCVYKAKSKNVRSFSASLTDSNAWQSSSYYNLIAHENRVYISGNSFSFFDIENETFTNYNKYNTEGFQGALSILRSDNGSIWGATGSELWQFNPVSSQFLHYDLSGKTGFVSGSCAKAANGNLWFGGMSGLVEVDPYHIRRNEVAPRIVFSGFSVQNIPRHFKEDLQLIDSLVLKPGENIFTISYSALSFTGRENISYQYKLQGFEEEWVRAGKRSEVTYTNLNPGTYTFIAKAIHADGLESDHPLMLTVIVQPFFWQSFWFRMLLALLFVSIGIMVYRARLNTLKLIQQKEIAEQSTAYKSKFLAHMSHEIRTPLNAIMGLNKLMLDSELSPKQRKFVEGIDVSCDSLLQIVNDILDQSRIEKGKLELRNEAFNLSEVLHQLKTLMGVKAQEKGLELRLEIAPNLPKQFMGDATRIFQVLANLVGNAIKFTNNGFVTIQVKQHRKTEDGVLVHFEIADSGIGIAKEKQGLIFESFEQVKREGPFEYPHQGTGLGLTIVKELVQQLGGSISLISQLQKGSTFLVELNLKIDERTPVPNYVEEKPNVSNKLRVLLVEDTPLNQFLTIEVLQQNIANVWIDCAENGAQALQMLKENEEYTIILMDVKMPVMDGIEATKRIRLDKKARINKTPILGLTANAIAEELEKCRQAGMNDCVTKPIDVAELLQKIKTLTDH